MSNSILIRAVEKSCGKVAKWWFLLMVLCCGKVGGVFGLYRAEKKSPRWEGICTVSWARVVEHGCGGFGEGRSVDFWVGLLMDHPLEKPCRARGFAVKNTPTKYEFCLVLHFQNLRYNEGTGKASQTASGRLEKVFKPVQTWKSRKLCSLTISNRIQEAGEH